MQPLTSSSIAIIIALVGTSVAGSVHAASAVSALPYGYEQEREEQEKEESQEADQEPQYKGWLKRRQDRRKKELEERYIKTDQTRRCVNPRRIRSSRALDDQHIQFILRGGDSYVNELALKCANLVRLDRFMYNIPSGNLCRGQIVTLLDEFGRSWNSCTLGDFQVLEKNRNRKAKDDNAESSRDD